MKKRQGQLITFLAPAAPAIAQILAANPHRVAIVFNGAVGDIVTYTTDNAGLANRGIVIDSRARSFVLTKEQVGELIERAWFAALSDNSAAKICTVFEIVEE